MDDLNIFFTKLENSLPELKWMGVKKIFILIITAILLMFGFYCSINISEVETWKLLTSLFSILIDMIILINVNHRYEENYKKFVVKPFFKYLRLNSKYLKYESIKKIQFNCSNLFRKNYNAFQGKDYVKIQYENKEVEFSNLLVEKIRRARRTSFISKYFKGLFFVVNSKENMNSKNGLDWIITNRRIDMNWYFLGSFLMSIFFLYFMVEFWNRKVLLIIIMLFLVIISIIYFIFCFLKSEDFIEYYNSLKIDKHENLMIYRYKSVEKSKLPNIKVKRKIINFISKEKCNLKISYVGNKIYFALNIKKDFFKPSFFTLINKKKLIKYKEYLEFVEEVSDQISRNSKSVELKREFEVVFKE